MKVLKKILLALLIVFIVIQFIQPARNISGQRLSEDLTKTFTVPENVLNIFKNSCYDCHSNYTCYPWYVNIQPIGWIMANHIRNGRENLNFSEFRNYSIRKQAHKLRAITKSVKENEMPISSYTMIHNDAKLTDQQKEMIMKWAMKTKDSLTIKK